MGNLFNNTIRIAHANPELRPLLLPLLKEAAGYAEIKKNLAAAAKLVDEGKLDEADKLIRSMLGKGMSGADLSAALTPAQMKKLRAHSKKRKKKAGLFGKLEGKKFFKLSSLQEHRRSVLHKRKVHSLTACNTASYKA